MSKNIFILFVCMFTYFVSNGQTPCKVIKKNDLLQLFDNKSDTTYIINFWATWCSPCIKELPDFEKIHRESANKKLKVILISLDFLKDLDVKLLPFLERKNISAQTFLLDETNYNSWIDFVEPQWQGNIPVTFIVNHHKGLRIFIDKETDYEFLVSQIK
jgi:thiol-disulfide isomerase/thioredoxin